MLRGLDRERRVALDRHGTEHRQAGTEERLALLADETRQGRLRTENRQFAAAGLRERTGSLRVGLQATVVAVGVEDEAARVAGIKPRRAREVLDCVRAAIARWPDFASEAGVRDDYATFISRQLAIC